MKKFLLSILSVLAIGVMANAETYTHTFSSGNLTTAGGEVVLSDITWHSTTATYIGFDSSNGRGIQIGSSKNPCASYSLTTSDFSNYIITSITVNSSMASSGDAKLTVSVGGNDVISSQSLTTSATDYTANDVNSKGNVVISWGCSAKAYYIKTISITYTVGDSKVVAKPTFSVDGGTYTEPFNLILSAETGNSIYYTLDGTTPTVDSNLYGDAIEISEYTVVKAVAIDDQGVSSSVATITYAFQNTQSTAMTVSEAIAWIDAGKDATTEQYVAGYITEITEVSTSYGNATYSIADAIDGTDVLVVFRGKYLNGEKFTAEDEIEVGDKVLLYGKLKDYNGTPELDTNNYIVSILEDAATGVEETLVDENAPVEYYNLQGVKVANPEKGIFIKKQGAKTTKVVL